MKVRSYTFGTSYCLCDCVLFFFFYQLMIFCYLIIVSGPQVLLFLTLALVPTYISLSTYFLGSLRYLMMHGVFLKTSDTNSMYIAWHMGTVFTHRAGNILWDQSTSLSPPSIAPSTGVTGINIRLRSLHRLCGPWSQRADRS